MQLRPVGVLTMVVRIISLCDPWTPTCTLLSEMALQQRVVPAYSLCMLLFVGWSCMQYLYAACGHVHVLVHGTTRHSVVLTCM